MSLFQGSTTTLTQAQQQIADSAGVSADSDMITRAGRAYETAIRHWNNVARWEALRIEASPLSVIAPFTVLGCGWASGATLVTSTIASAFDSVLALDLFSGSGVLKDMQVSSLAATAGATAFTATRTATASATGVTLTFTRDLYDLPSDFKAVYTARMLSLNRTLSYLQRRKYDRLVADQGSTSTPVAYDLFRVGDVGKIRLVPPPATADTLKVRYYRRMSKTATPIDVHDDWEPYILAFAKWAFLTDKKDGSERATEWKSFAMDGMARMMKENVETTPDEDLAFEPRPTEPSFALNPFTPAEAWP